MLCPELGVPLQGSKLQGLDSYFVDSEESSSGPDGLPCEVLWRPEALDCRAPIPPGSGSTPPDHPSLNNRTTTSPAAAEARARAPATRSSRAPMLRGRSFTSQSLLCFSHTQARCSPLFIEGCPSPRRVRDIFGARPHHPQVAPCAATCVARDIERCRIQQNGIENIFTWRAGPRPIPGRKRIKLLVFPCDPSLRSPRGSITVGGARRAGNIILSRRSPLPLRC